MAAFVDCVLISLCLLSLLASVRGTDYSVQLDSAVPASLGGVLTGTSASLVQTSSSDSVPATSINSNALMSRNPFCRTLVLIFKKLCSSESNL